MLRRRIPSDIQHLNELNRTYKFVPNEFTCRPRPDIRAIKDETLVEIEEKWASMEDFVLFRIFGKKFDWCDGKFVVKDRTLPADLRLFRPNEFPYNIDEGNHWIMWYSTKEPPCDEDTITRDINVMLHNMFHGSTRPLEDAPKILYYKENEGIDILESKSEQSEPQQSESQQPSKHSEQLQIQSQQSDLLGNVKACEDDDTLDTYDFAWYPNPKVSVPDFYHVHVFWKHLRLKKDQIYLNKLEDHSQNAS